MQYQFTERYEYVKTIEFKNSLPLHIQRIRYFKEDEISGTFTKKEFRYSWDNVVWTNWNTLTQGNLSGIVFRDQPDFYLHVRYSRNGIGSGNIGAWYLYYDSQTPTPPVPPPDASIDADTLGGQPPSYYLDRENFFGPYTDLNISNVIDGSTIGVYSHRVDTSLGTEFFFKRIDGDGLIQVSEGPSGIISITADPSVIGGVSYTNPDPVGETVGGITDGETFFAGGKTFAETMEAIFYPLKFPALTPPSNTFTENIANLQEIGATVPITFISTLNRGSINPQYTADSPYRSGLGNTVYYTGPGLPGSVGSYPSSPNSQSISHVIIQGYNTWSSAWAYDGGVQPYDSKGNPFDSSLAAGTTSYISRSIEGVYPVYATWQSLNPTKLSNLYSMLNPPDIVIDLVAYPPFQPDPQAFDIANTWLVSNPLQGVETWNPLTSSWEYEGGTAQLSIDNFWVQTPTTHIVNGIVNYTRFSYTGPEADPRGASQIRLKF